MAFIMDTHSGPKSLLEKIKSFSIQSCLVCCDSIRVQRCYHGRDPSSIE
jgi:hypothetical protein